MVAASFLDGIQGPTRNVFFPGKTLVVACCCSLHNISGVSCFVAPLNHATQGEVGCSRIYAPFLGKKKRNLRAKSREEEMPKTSSSLPLVSHKLPWESKIIYFSRSRLEAFLHFLPFFRDWHLFFSFFSSFPTHIFSDERQMGWTKFKFYVLVPCGKLWPNSTKLPSFLMMLGGPEVAPLVRLLFPDTQNNIIKNSVRSFDASIYVVWHLAWTQKNASKK